MTRLRLRFPAFSRRLVPHRRVAPWGRRALLPIALVLLAGVGVGAARADSEPGHRIVAAIAEQFLDERAAAHLQALLAIDDLSSLDAVATLDISQASHGPQRDCRNGACIVAKLDHSIAVLRDKSASAESRLVALKFVVCLATDIHQPLRVADNGDHGGARVVLVDDGRRTNLRDVWDDAAADETDDTREIAAVLARTISAGDRREWQKGSPADWANESHAVARSFVYRYLPRNGILTSGYEAGAQEVMRDRLRRAGVRLAWILNRSL